MERMGKSVDQVLDGSDFHFTGDGVSGEGGSIAGARRDFVAESTLSDRFGGIRKCKCSSLVGQCKL